MPQTLNIESLSSETFGMFGDVIGGDMPGNGVAINQGTTLKFDAQALSLDANGGQAKAYLYRAQGQNLPLSLQVLERHRLGSQTFVPLNGVSFIVVVAASSIDSSAPDLASLRAF